MRLMLGTDERPELLVDVEDYSNPNEFKFWVVNGAWEGKYTNGHLTIDAPHGAWSTLDTVKVLCDNEDRLRGSYTTVFENFDNPDYFAPKPLFTVPASWDDDIPF